jgi:hypothetical protein
METANVVDYSYPMLMAHKALKNAHDAILKDELLTAAEHLMVAMAEVKLTLNAVKSMQESAR